MRVEHLAHLILLITLIFKMTKSKLQVPKYPDFKMDQLAVRSLLKIWNEKFERSRRLTIVIDKEEQRDSGIFDPREFSFEKFPMTTRLISISSGLEKKSTVSSKIDINVDRANCVLLLFLDIERIRRILIRPNHLATFWRPENFYVIRQVGSRSSHLISRKFLRWALERLWRIRGIHRIVVSIGEKYFRYDPFVSEESFKNNGGAVNDGIIVEDRGIVKDGDFYVLEDRERFDGYRLRVSIFPTVMMKRTKDGYGGIDGKLAVEVCRMMNVTPVLVTSKDGFGWKDKDRFVGSLADLIYGEADVSFNEFFVKDYLTRDVEMATYFSGDYLCVIVPKARPVPDHLIIFRVFTLKSWLLIAIGKFVISFIYKRMRRIDLGLERFSSAISGTLRPKLRERNEGLPRSRTPNDESSTRKDPISRAEASPMAFKNFKFYLLLLASGKSLTRLFFHLVEPLDYPRPRFSERLLLWCSLIMGLIVNGILTSGLTSSFSKQSYFEDIHTLEELDRSGLEIFTNMPDLLDDALMDEESTVITSLREKTHYENGRELFQRIFVKQDAAMLRRKAYARLELTGKMRKKLHLVEECPKVYSISPLTRAGSPFLERINAIVGRLNNGGFYDKWYHMLIEESKVDYVVEETETQAKLTMNHFRIPFLILFVGLASSVIVFAYECTHIVS